MRKRALLITTLALVLALPAMADNPPVSGSSSTPVKTPLDSTIKTGSDDEISDVFRDMGVVQRRAMRKGGRFLLSTYGTLDFSDGPYTNYSLSLNPGYAISDFFEVYAQFSPLYLFQKRSIVDLVSQLYDSNGAQAEIVAARPKYQYGLEFLWAPLYGKDSMGMSRILRSDTFLKFGISQIKYDTDKGLGIKFGVGKTFFINRNLGFRFCVNYGSIQTVIDNEKSSKGLLLLEMGANFYF